MHAHVCGEGVFGQCRQRPEPGRRQRQQAENQREAAHQRQFPMKTTVSATYSVATKLRPQSSSVE